jgi:copper chaperone CopZ
MNKKVISLLVISVLSAPLAALACDESNKPNKEVAVQSNLSSGQKSPVTAVKGYHVFNVEGMTCKNCVAKVKKAIGNVKGVKEVRVDLKLNSATVVLSPDSNTKEVNMAITKAVEKSGFKATIITSKS